MSAVEQPQTFLGEPTPSSNPDETFSKSSSHSGSFHKSMLFAIEKLVSEYKESFQLRNTGYIFDLDKNRLVTMFSLNQPIQCPDDETDDETQLFTIPNDETPIQILLKPFLVRNPNSCDNKYDHSFFDSKGKPYSCSKEQNEMRGGSSCLGLIIRPYIDVRMIDSDGKRQIHIIFDLEIEKLSETENCADMIQGYTGLRKEIYVKIHDSIRGLPKISLDSHSPTLFGNPEDIGRICVWISYDIQLPDSVIAKCSHVAFDVNYMCIHGTSTFPIPNGLIFPGDENFPIPKDPRDE